MQIGLVGCGFIGRVQAWAIQMLADAQIVSARLAYVHDRESHRAEQIAEHHGGAAVDLDTLLDGSDVIWICTWTSEHLALVEAAADRDVAVFCEKPLGRDLAESEKVAAALQRVPHQVGLVLRSSPVFRSLAQCLGDGRFGPHLATVLRDDQYLPVQGIYRSEWRADATRAGGGTLIEHSIHDIDMLRWLHGQPDSVSAQVAERLGNEGIDDTAVVVARYPDSATSTLVSVWHQVLTRESSRRMEVFCRDALLWLDDDGLGPLHIETSAGEEVLEPPVDHWVEQVAAALGLAPSLVQMVANYGTAAKEFLDAVSAGRSGCPGAGDALMAHRLVDAAYRSSATGGLPVPTAL